MKSTKQASLAHEMLELHGPIISGAALYRALGFKTYAAFYRAQKAGGLGVRAFRLPGRRGLFVLTTEVADWIAQHAGTQDFVPPNS